MSFYAGIDIGSRNTKLVVYDSLKKQIAFDCFCDTGVNPPQTVDSLLKDAYNRLHIQASDILKLYATGYGRSMIKSDKVVSEISCHTIGVQYYFPEVRTIIDIGGQDSKIISIDDDNKIKDFVMNDKCAAGTGRFLEMVALRLAATCDSLGEIAAVSNREIHLSSTCVVFAESEIIGLISQHASTADITRAVHLSIADRIVSQINQLEWHPPVAFTGGVALNSDVKDIIAHKIENTLLLPPNPEITAALGAAILAAKDYE